MEAIDVVTGRKINLNKRGVYRVAIRYVETELLYGYTRHIKETTYIVFHNKDGFSFGDNAIKKNFDNLFYSSVDDCFYCETNMPEKAIITKKFCLPTGRFPYSFQRKYEAIENFDLFYDKQLKINDIDFPISKVFKYTFGLEFETSMGVVSEEDCFKLGLIPLRDGSISGIEYATVKLEGNGGFNLLKRQLEVLRKQVHFNKNCSLHVHLGGFPLEKEALWRLYRTIYNVTRDLQNYLPKYCFDTGAFKSNGKNYCGYLPNVGSFNELFKYMTGRNFMGSFTQPHPRDLTRQRKWEIPQRYFMCNLVNMFCYNVNKTVEFRFLAPTFNLEKILTWLYIFNGILLFAEKHNPIYNDLKSILQAVYSEEVYNMLDVQLHKLNTLRNNQERNLDYCGSDIYLESQLFDENKII